MQIFKRSTDVLQELLAVNEEFAAEVERLYKSEEQHLAEKEELGRQLQLQQGGGQLQLQEERGQLELQIRRLTQALDSTKLEYQQLQDTNTRREQHLSSKQEVGVEITQYQYKLIMFAGYFTKSRKRAGPATEKPGGG